MLLFLLYIFLPALEHSLSSLLIIVTPGTGIPQVKLVICLLVLCDGIDTGPAKACSPSTACPTNRSHTPAHIVSNVK